MPFLPQFLTFSLSFLTTTRMFPGRFLTISGRSRPVSYRHIHSKPIRQFCRQFQTCSRTFPDPFTPFHDRFWRFPTVTVPSTVISDHPPPFPDPNICPICGRWYFGGILSISWYQNMANFVPSRQTSQGVGYFIWKVFNVCHIISLCMPKRYFMPSQGTFTAPEGCQNTAIRGLNPTGLSKYQDPTWKPFYDHVTRLL